MEYKSAIVDECGDVIEYCENLTQDEIDEYLNHHSECSIRLIEWE